MTPSRITLPRALAPVVLAPGLVLLAACGPSNGTANPGRTVTVTAQPSTSAPSASAPPATVTSSPAPATSTPAPAGPQPCPTSSLRASLGLSQGAAGSVYQVIDFTNISDVSCTLYGYPGVSMAGGSPVTQIGAAATENPATPRKLVTLVPGETGNALLRIVQPGDFPVSKCAPVNATYLQIYPPNQTTPVYLAYRSQACSKPLRFLTVNAVVRGTGG